MSIQELAYTLGTIGTLFVGTMILWKLQQRAFNRPSYLPMTDERRRMLLKAESDAWAVFGVDGQPPIGS